jgi:hypothetical protein
MSYEPQKSDYNLKLTPNRLYIDSSFETNASQMYKKFAEKEGFKPIIDGKINRESNIESCTHKYYKHSKV